MSNILSYKNKIHDTRPYSTNPTYQKEIEAKCQFCINNKQSGRRKIYHSLWHLFKHISYHHSMESTRTAHIQTLANKIIKGEKI